MRTWWRGFLLWVGDSDTSLVVVPVTGDPVIAGRRLRKALRDERDRAASRRHPRWRAMAMAGLIDRDRALILIKHPDIARAEVGSMLERRWPDVWLGDAGNMQPSGSISVEAGAALARRRRGIEPIRIVILAQRETATPVERWDDQPMPFVF
jgi:hypothetical protein